MTLPMRSTFRHRPGTRLGWWSVRLGAAFLVLYAINSFVFMPIFAYNNNPALEWSNRVLPFYGIFMMLCGLAAGIAGLVAILRSAERSWMVWLTLLPGAFVLIFLLGEFLIPH